MLQNLVHRYTHKGASQYDSKSSKRRLQLSTGQVPTAVRTTPTRQKRSEYNKSEYKTTPTRQKKSECSFRCLQLVEHMGVRICDLIHGIP